MIDRRAELGLRVGRLETILIDHGMLDESGQPAINGESNFPKELEDALDGFIENPVELVGLLKICRDARDGRPLSPAVLSAAHLMAREVIQALQSAETPDER
ncbi:hypothetical protein HGP14_32640 [Rhizobium sp. P32RR-XVIII]|uniref:hypothetical protein n=1 Tax=Rhizobium sp. P32RR-XVIII TaxID=2726738 RepID=UPI0014569DC4|nr:hypothetical protein [Rhizobium sp. P32RR-XVIII]NLS07970.1 hypothetical protein [Rhizobium sp. P32RR-XVIII]